MFWMRNKENNFQYALLSGGLLIATLSDPEVMINVLQGRVAQLVRCLTADPGVASLIQTQSHTFTEIDHEIISTTILLPSADSRRVVVSYKRSMCMNYLLTTLSSLPRKKSVVSWTDHPDMTKAVDSDQGRKKSNQTKKNGKCSKSLNTFPLSRFI